MAAVNITFKMPQEPCPLPSLESDDESFVVLGQSIPDSSNDGYVSPVDLSVVAEAKKLLNSEIEALEQMKNKQEEKRESFIINKDVTSQEPTNMETSTALPVMPVIEKGFESTNAISIVSFSGDMSSEEVQNKISQMIEENIRLKDTVLKNNDTLKAQYEKIVNWQEGVQKVHMAHKEKLLEAKNIIEKLKTEKDNLKHDLAQHMEDKKIMESEIASFKKALRETITNEVLVQRSDENMKEFQLEVANKKIKDLEAEIEKLTIQNKKLVDDAAKVQDDDIRKKEFQLEVANGKIVDLQLENEKLAAENVKLRNDSTIMIDLNEKLETMTLRERENKESDDKLRTELTQITRELDDAKIKVEELRKQMSEKIRREEALIMTTNTLKAQIEMSSNHSEEIKNLRTQLAQTQTSLTQTEFSRGQAYAQLSQLTEQLSRMKRDDRTTAAGPSDEICALKLQLDVYKTDFEEERHARETIKNEKDRLEEDIQHLQRRNQQLQEEIEMLRGERDYVIYPSQAAPVPNRVRDPSNSSSSSTDACNYKCPKCEFGFNSMTKLQNHVYRCIELDDHLP